MYPEKITKEADFVKAAGKIFRVDKVKVQKWDAPWVTIAVGNLVVTRMGKPKAPRILQLA